MFEFFFKHPAAVFARGQYVLLSRWPSWALAAAIAASAAALAWLLWRRRSENAALFRGARPAAIWFLQAAFAALLLLLLWRPAISISTLKPQQNVIAVLVDDSRSMSVREEGGTRIEQARRALGGEVLAALEKKQQVRLFRFGQTLEPLAGLNELSGTGQATRIGDALGAVAVQAASLPIGAVVLVSDGADNSGGVGREALNEIRSRRIPVYTVGVGREKPGRDVEISEFLVPPRTLADSRVAAQVTFRQSGYRGRPARVTISSEGRQLASRDVVFAADYEPQTETLSFSAGIAGPKVLEASIALLEGEENPKNNVAARPINVEAGQPRILYLEGDPRWEFKFIRRALEEDRNLAVASILRTTQNKIYRQGIRTPGELEQGFPISAEELFAFQGLIVGNVEAAYLTLAQQELIREFANRRGGGVLFLGGRTALSDGGYSASSFAEMLPVTLPERKRTFHRDPAKAVLTAAGRESLLCRLLEDPGRNAERWSQLPPLADYQETGGAKPAAAVLLEAETPGRGRFPLLVTQNYGRGRTAVFATGGSWRWKMLSEHSDTSHHTFWRQLARWLAAGAPGPVALSVSRPALFDEGRIRLLAEVRDKTYALAAGAVVEVRISGPEGAAAAVSLRASANEAGVYEGEWNAQAPGAYLVEAAATRGAEHLGRDTLVFRREDGVAENFRTEQNRELLERLAAETGGRYYRPDNLRSLSEEVSFSEAGISVREVRDLWDMPAVFLLLIGLRAAEWLLRRRWGAV